MNIRIESDGTITKVFVDGKQIPKATMAYFFFCAEPCQVYCVVEKVKTDKKGNILIDEKDQSIAKESKVLINTMSEGNEKIIKIN